MNVEIGTEAPIFLVWEYLFQIFGILSLQCGTVHYKDKAWVRTVYNTKTKLGLHESLTTIEKDVSIFVVSPTGRRKAVILSSLISPGPRRGCRRDL
jgi:hypothetical protein